jgi:hypothetical protein
LAKGIIELKGGAEMGKKIVRVKAYNRRAPKEREPKREKSLIEQAAEDTYKRLSGKR